MSDRVVYAERGEERVVRYVRAGKWYIEHGLSRQHVGVKQAARKAFELGHGGLIYEGQPGGATFDREIGRLTSAHQVVSWTESQA